MARRNMIPGRYTQGGMQKQQMQSAVHDFLEFGDTALLKLRNYFGKVIGLWPIPTMYLRKRKNGNFAFLERGDKQKSYKKEDIIFIKQYDPVQQVYGGPDYLGCVQSCYLVKTQPRSAAATIRTVCTWALSSTRPTRT